MRVAFDTSVLVAASLSQHPHHVRAAAWLNDSAEMERIASWHAMAKTRSTLTRIPMDPPTSPDLARQVIERLESRLDLVAPTAQTYREAIRRCSSRGLRSGGLFDALHLVTARRRAADRLVTFNAADFLRIRESDDPEIVVPPA